MQLLSSIKKLIALTISFRLLGFDMSFFDKNEQNNTFW